MKKIILLSMLVMALFVNCTGAQKKTVSKELHPDLKGGVFVTSFYTGVKYNDIVVKDKDGNVIFEDDFSSRKEAWEGGDEWETVDGQVQMLDSFNFDSRYAVYNTEWEAKTIVLKGTRVEGDEGICLGFGAKNSDTFYQLMLEDGQAQKQLYKKLEKTVDLWPKQRTKSLMQYL